MSRRRKMPTPTPQSIKEGLPAALEAAGLRESAPPELVPLETSCPDVPAVPKEIDLDAPEPPLPPMVNNRTAAEKIIEQLIEQQNAAHREGYDRDPCPACGKLKRVSAIEDGERRWVCEACGRRGVLALTGKPSLPGVPVERMKGGTIIFPHAPVMMTPEEARPTYEYHREWIADDTITWTARANALGAEGWKLVCVRDQVYYWMREKKEG